MDRKATLWLELGAGMVWIIDPRERTIAVHEPGHHPRVLTDSERLSADPVLPGFECAVSVFFEN